MSMSELSWDVGDPEPVPVMVYKDETNPANNLTCFLGISGCIGDVPFTAVVANSCGHTARKGCKFCFAVGCTCNADDEALNTVRHGGYDRTSKSTTAHLYGRGGGWEVRPLCFSAEDGSFDATEAANIRVTPELHAMRRQSAEDCRAQARQQHPPPVRPADAVGGNTEQLEWQAGVATPPWIQRANVAVI